MLVETQLLRFTQQQLAFAGPKTSFRGERRLQMSGSGSNVFRSIHSLYNSSAKKGLPQTLNLHLQFCDICFCFGRNIRKTDGNCIDFVRASFALKLHFLVRSSNTIPPRHLYFSPVNEKVRLRSKIPYLVRPVML